MKTSSVILLSLLAFSAQASAQMKLNLELVPPVGKATLCEPIKLRIGWQNTSEKPIAIGKRYNPATSSAVSLVVNGETHRMPLPGTTLEIEDPLMGTTGYLQPQQKLEGEVELAALDLPPGDYRIQAVADFRGRASDSFSGIAESAVVTLKLDSPRGIDLTAYEYHNEHQDRDKDAEEERESSPCSTIMDREGPSMGMLLSEFPDSIYAAWLILPSLYAPNSWDPIKIKEFLATGSWPLPNSVPDPSAPGGWRKYEGAALAHWQMEWTERILKNHPDFAYADRLKLVLAIDQLAVGDKKTGTLSLQQVARNEDTAEGAWAKKFLALPK